MRRARTVACSACDARWDAARARFCGWCGRPLRAIDLPDAEAPRRPARWPRRLVWTGWAAGGAAALAAILLLADGLALPRSGSDPVVELADEGDEVVPQGSPLSAEERAALLAPFDPARLRCEPQGCEVWRHDLVDRSGRHTNVAPLGDLVVVNAGNEVTAYDAATGEERWRQRWPGAESAPAATNWVAVLPTEDGDVVVLARPERGDLLALRSDGGVAWHEQGVDAIHHLLVAGDTLLTSALSPGMPPTAADEVDLPSASLVARDLATGDVRWQRDAAALMNASERYVLAQQDGATVVLDPATGSELARRELALDAWLHPVGEVLILYGEGRQALLSADLEPLPGLDDLAEAQPVTAGRDLVLALRHGDAGEGTPDRLLLVEPDGRVRWTAELDTPTGTGMLCCPQPMADGEVLLVPSLPGGGPPAFGTADGTRVELVDSALADAATQGWWWMTPTTALEHRADSVVLHHAGGRVEVTGQDTWPVTDRPPFVMTNGRSLLAVQPVPAD